MSKQTATQSQFSRLTRVMAAFTASLFLVSSQLALPAQANELARAARGDMNRQEWRQFRQENRGALRIPEANQGPGALPGNPVVTPGFIPNPSQLNPVRVVAPDRIQNRLDKAERRENRQAARGDGNNTIQNKAQRAGVRAERVQAKQERVNAVRADRFSSLVIQENAGQIIRLDNGANLDLTASNSDITIGDKLIADGGFVTIKVGDGTKNVYAGSKVTAAEYVAVKQAISGNQTLVVDASGKATGGTVDLGTIAATKNTMKASSLTVGEGVTAVGDLDRRSSFRLDGDLNNFGSIYAVNTQGGNRGSAEIAANNITNNEGALISSNAGSQFGNKASTIDLSLSANNNFSNKGTIESSGDLSISAGNSISNGSGSQITANNNLNLSSKTIANAGTISSTTRDINLDAPVGADLDVNNNGGTLQALQGAINVRAPNYNGTNDSTIYGGDLLSKQVNMNTGLGTTDINVGQLTGEVIGSGTAAHVEAQTENLMIGETCLTGDPTYKNTAGDITFTGSVAVGEALAVLASGNILSSVNGQLDIVARDVAGNGRNILMTAGFGVSGVGPDPTSISGAPPANATLTNTQVTSAGATGGNIDLTNGGLTTAVFILANASPGAGDGGNVQLYAREAGGNGGAITLPTNGLINTSGNGFGALNGNITAFAGATNGTTLTLPSLQANGGVGTVGGSITVQNIQPSPAGGTVTVAPNGEIIGSFFQSTGAVIANGGIRIGNGLAGSTVNAHDNITVGAGSGGAILNVLTVNTLGGNVDVTANAGNATLQNTTSVTTNGGNLNLVGVNARQISLAPGVIDTTNGGLAGGDVTFTAVGGAASINSAINSGVGLISLSGSTGAQVSGNITTNDGSVTLTTTAGDVLAQGNITTNGGDVILNSNTGDVLVATPGTSINTSGGSGGDVNISSGVTRLISTLGITTGGGDVNILNGAVNIGGAIDATNGTTGGLINITTASNNITLTDDLTAGTSINLNAGIATVLVPDGIVLTANDFSLVSNMVVGGGTGTVTIAPLTDGTQIGIGAGGAGSLSITQAELDLISADTLNVGDLAVTGGIILAGPLNVSGAGPGNFNLNFFNGGDFEQNLQTITLGDKNLLIDVAGNVQLDADIDSTTGNVTVDAGGNSLGFVAGAAITTTTGDVSLTSAGSIGTGIFSITSTSGDIDVVANGGNVLTGDLTTGGAGTIFVFANGVASSAITGNLTTSTGSIGVFSNDSINTGDIATNGGILTLSTLTDITTGDIAGIGNAAGLVLNVNGDIEVGNVTLNGATQDIILTAGDDVNFGNLQTTGVNRGITLTAGTMNSTGGDIGNNNSGDLTVNGGGITLSASDDIETGDIDANGGTLNFLVTAPATRLDNVNVGDISGITNNLVINAGFNGGSIVVGEVLFTAAGQSILLNTNVPGGLGSIFVNGDLQATGAGAVISLISGFSVFANDLTTTDGDITVTATNGGVNVEDVQTGFGNILLTANNGSVEFEDIVSNAGGSLTVSAGDTIDMQTLPGTVSLTGGNGNVSLTSLNGDVLLNNITVVGTGTITVDAGDFIFGNGFGAVLTSDAGDVTLTAAGGVGVLDIVSNTGDIRITANGANILVGDLTTGGTAVIELLADGDIQTDDLTTAGGYVLVTSANGDVSVLDVTTGAGNIDLTATTGSVEFEDVVSTAGGSLTVTAGDTIDMQNFPGTVSLTGGNGSVSLTSINGDVLLNDITVVGTGTITVDSGDFIFGNGFGATLTTDQGDVTLTAAGGVGVLDVVSNAGDIRITANGANILVGDLSTGVSGVIELQAETDIDTGSLTSFDGNIELTSNTGDVDTNGNDISTNQGEVFVTAFDTFLNNVTLAGTGRIIINSSDETEVSGDLSTTSGLISITSGSNLETFGNVSTTSGDITFDTEDTNFIGGNVTSGSGNIVINSGLTVATGDLLFTGTQISTAGAGTIAITSASDSDINGTISTAGGTVDITSGDSTFINNITTNGGNLTINSGIDTDGLILGASNISTGAGNVEITSGQSTGLISVATTTGNIDIVSNGLDSVVNQLGSVVSRNVTSTSGNIFIDSTVGATSVGFDITTPAVLYNISTGGAGTITINSAGSAGGLFGTLTGNLSTDSGLISLTAAADGTGTGNITTNSGNVVINSADNVEIGFVPGTGNVSTGTGDVTVTADTSILVAGNVTGTTNDVTLTAGTDITVQSIVLTGLGSDIVMDAGGSITTNGVVQADPITMLSGTTITLGGNVVADNGILLVAGQDITTSVPSVAINGTSTLGNAGDITLIAGANFTNNGTSVTINGGSATGGNIAGGITSINANSTAAGGSGGDVTLTAFNNAGAGGQILLPTANIVTSGQGTTGASGNVTIVGGNTTAGSMAIQVGSITTTSSVNGVNGTGDVALVNVVPTGGFTVDTNAAVGSISGTLFGNSIAVNDVAAGNIRAAGADIAVFSGQDVQLGVLNVSSKADAGADAGTILVESNGSAPLNIGGALTPNYIAGLAADGAAGGGVHAGGLIIVNELSNSGIVVNGPSISATTPNGAGGVVSLNANSGTADITLNGATINAGGGGILGPGGAVVLTGDNLNLVGANSTIAVPGGTALANGGDIIINMTGGAAINIGTGAAELELVNLGGGGSEITINNGGGINVQSTGSFAADSVSLISTAGNVTSQTGGNISAIDMLLSAVAGTVQMNGNVNGTLTNTVIAIGNVTGSGTYSGGVVNLTSTGGSVTGLGPNALNIDAVDLTVNAAVNVNLNELTGVNFVGSSSADTGSFVIVANNDITGSAGHLLSSATNMGLTSTNGNVGVDAANRINVDAAGVFDVVAGNSAFIHGVGDLLVGVGNAGGTLNLLADNNLTVNGGGPLFGNNIILRAQNGALSVGQLNAVNRIFLRSNASILNANIAGQTLSATTVDMRSDAGDIGANVPGGFIAVNAVNLSANAPAGSVFVIEGNNSGLNIGGTLSSSAGNTFDVQAGGNLTNDQTITASDVFLTSSNGSINLGALVTGTNSVTLTANQSILNGNVAGNISAPNLTLTSTTGSIGTLAQAVLVDAINVTLSAATGINVADTAGGLNVVSANTTNGNLAITTAGAGGFLTSSAAPNGLIEATNGSVTLTSLLSDITLNNDVTAGGGDIALAAGGSITTQPGAPFGGGTVLSATGNVIGTALGNITIGDDVLAGDGVATAADITFTSIAGNITTGVFANLGTAADSANNVSLLASIGTISIGQGIEADNDVTLFAGGNVTIGAGTSDINAGNNIFVGSTTGAIAVGNTMNAGADLTLQAQGNVTSNAAGDLNADTVNVVSVGGGVTLGAPVTATTSIDISAFNNITNGSFVALNAPEINLTSTGGSIGTGAGSRLLLNVDQATFNAFTNVFVENTASLEIGPGKSSANGIFDVLVSGAGNTLTVTGEIDPVTVVLTSAGTIEINNLITASGSITVTSTGGSILDSLQTGTLVAPQVNLSALNTIGGGTTLRINMDADDLVANAAAGVWLFDSDNINVNGPSGSTGFFFSLVSNGDLTNTAVIAADQVALQSNGGAIDLGANVISNSSVFIQASGDINNDAGTSVSGTTASITSLNGNIGGAGNRFNVAISNGLNVNADSAGADVFIHGIGNLVLGSSSAASQLNVRADNNLTLALLSTQSANIINFRAVNGALDLESSTLNASNRINLRSALTIDTNSISGASLNTPQANFTSDLGDILLGPADITVASLTANAFGDVVIATNNGVNIGPGSNSAGGLFQIVSTGNSVLSVNGTIDASEVVLNSGGTVSIQNTVTGTASIQVIADGSILNGDINGNLLTSNLLLQSNFGSIGTPGQRVLVDTTNLTVIANGPGGAAYIRDTAAGLNMGGIFGASSTTGVMDIRSDNFLTTTASLTSNNGDVNLTSANQSITLGANVTASQNVNITAETNFTSNVGGTINSDNGDVNITTNTGSMTIGDTVTADANIGLNVGTDLTTTTAGTLNAGTNVNAFVGDSATFNGDVNAAQNAAGGITVATAGNITTGATADLEGDFVSLTSALGSISLNDDVTANNGNINLSALFNITTAPSSILDADGDVIGIAGLDINLGDDVNAGGAIDFTATTGNLTTGGSADLEADTVSLEATNGNLTLNDTVTANAGDVNLFAGTTLTTNDGATIDADNSVFAAANTVIIGDDINAGTDINLSAIAGVTTTGVADLQADNNVNILVFGGSANINDSVTAGNDISIGATGNINTFAGGTLTAGNNVVATALTDINIGDDVSADQDVTATAQNINSTTGSSISGQNVDLQATTGSFDLDGGVFGITSVTLQSNLGITNANVSGGLGAPQINLISDNGNIGTNAGSRLALDFDSVSAVATNGAVFLSDTAGTLNIGGAPSFASGTFDALAVGDITTTDTITGNNIVVRSTGGSLTNGALISGFSSVTLRALTNLSVDAEVEATAGAGTANLRADNGILVLNADVTADAVTLRSGSNMTSPLGTANGTTSVSLTSDNGNIGVDALNPFVVNTPSTTINAPNGSAWVRDNSVAATVNLQQSNALNTLSFVGINNVNVAGQLTATDINVQSEQTFFFINANVIASNSVTLQSRFDITDANFVNVTTIQAPNTTLISDLGSIGAFGNTLDLDLNTVNFDAANGSVYFFDPTGLTVGGAVTNVLADFDVTANGALATTAAINAGNVFLTSLNSTLNVGANVNAAFAADLQSFGNMTTSGGAVVQAFDITLLSTNGNIGTGTGSRFQINGNNITANAPFGSVFLNAANAINFAGNSGAFSTFDLTAGGNITQDLGSAVTGLNINLVSGGAFILGGTITAGNTINATSVDSILAAGVGPTTFSATQLNLTSITGDIGLNAGNRLVIDADNLTANAANGNVFIDGGAGALNIGLGDSEALFAFNVTAGTLSTSGDIEANDVVLTSTVGGLSIDADVTGNNSVVLNSATTLSQTGGTIFGGDLDVTYTTGNTDLTSAVDSLTTNAAGTNFSLNNAGVLTLLSQNVNDLTINNVGTINTGDDVAVTGNLSLNTFLIGNINLNDNITAGGDVILHAGGLIGSSTITQTGGTLITGQLLDLAWVTGNVNLVSAVTGLTAIAPGRNLTLTNTGNIALGAIDLNSLTLIVNSDITVNTDISLVDVLLQANTGDIILNANVNGTNTVTLRAFDTITQNSGLVTGGALTLSYNNGPVTLDTDVASVSVVAVTAGPTFDPSATTLTINDGGDINVLTTFVDSLTVNAFGDINIAGNVDAATLASFSSGFGDITQAGGFELRTDNLQLTGDGTISILDTFSFTNTQEITVTGSSVANVTTGEFGTVILNGSSATSLFLDASGATEVTTAGNTTVSQFLDITTPVLNNQFALAAGNILSVQSPTGDLTINGGAGGSLTSGASIELTATSGDLIFTGNQNFFGVANLYSNPNPPFGSIVISTGANVVGDSAVNLYTCDLQLQGTLIGNPVNLFCVTGGGTIANSIGNVNLASNINLIGLNFAIIASGSINGNGFSINLSDPAGDGGTLTMLAGFDFTPATPGQIDNTPILFTLNGPSVTGGNINMSTSTITSNGGAGNGGNLFAAAVNGGVFNGDINLGTVNLNGSVNGGNVNVLAGGNLTTNGVIDVTGGVQGGNVNLQVTAPQIVGTVYVANGDVLGGGAIVGSGLGANGNIAINDSITTSQNGTVSVLGANGAADTITQNGGTVTANTLNIEAGVGSVAFNSGTTVNFLNSDAFGSVYVNNNQPLGFITLSSITGSTQDFHLDNFGGVLSNGPINVNSVRIHESSTFGIVINGAITTVADIGLGQIGGGDITIQAAGSLTAGDEVDMYSSGGDITIGGAVLATNNVLATADTGDINVNASVTATVEDVQAFAGNDININGNTTAGLDLILDAGNNLTINANLMAGDAVVGLAGGAINQDGDVDAADFVGFLADGNVDINGNLNAGENTLLLSDTGDVNVNASATVISGLNVTLDASNDVNVNGSVTATGEDVHALAGNNINVNAAINAGLDAIFNANNNIDLNSAVTAGDAVVGSTTTGDIFVDANMTGGEFVGFFANGNVSSTGVLTGGNAVDLNSATGDVNVGGNIFAGLNTQLIAANNINFTNSVTVDGGGEVNLVAGLGINGGAVNVTLFGDDSITANNIVIGGDFSALAVNGGSNIALQGVNAGGNLTLLGDNVSANGALVSGIDTVINAGQGFTTLGDITATGDVFIVTSTLTNTNTITGDEVFVTSFAGDSLVINGGAGGTYTATGGDVNFGTGTTGDITFTGASTFNGTTQITPGGPGFSVIVANGANVLGNNDVFLNTCSLILEGNGTINGNLLHFNCPNGAGTIANASGDVDLTGINLVFDGQALAILASGSIIGGSTTLIDLSSSTGNGGNLLAVAGFDFTPGTGGVQVGPNDVLYTLAQGGGNVTGGDIDFSTLNIVTNGTGAGNGGNVTLVAAAGTVGGGTVAFNDITANGGVTGNGGNILVIAEGGFTQTGTISNTGVVVGTTTLAAAQPTIIGGDILVGNGENLGPGSFSFGPITGSGTIANSNGDVDLSGLDLTIVGLDLAIIASGNVNAGTTTIIDLSNGAGAGGDLLVVAGFDFAPPTPGQVNFNSGTLYTFGSGSATGGNINLGGLTITTDGVGGDAGDVTLVAKAGALNAGTIVTGAISAVGTAGGNGGDILVIAEGGFNVGPINNTGAVAGLTTLAGAAPIIQGGPITVQNGTQGGTGFFTFGAATAGGTIANMSGNIDLSGLNLNFTGLDLAIIASGNIIAGTTTTIDLSNGAGAGGDLLVVAGFDFTPTTGNVQTNFNTSTTYTFGAPSATGGNINFAGLTITTNGTGADAGDVTLVAAAGLTNDGTIITGDINAIGTGGGNGGDILVIAEGGFVVGNTNNTGAVNGTTTLAAATPEITGGPITVLNGTQGGPGAFTFTAPTGNGTIANSNGDVILSSNLTFTGLNLAIIASGSITTTVATTISLADLSGIGGNLTMIAGFDFTPATAGQVTDTTQLFTIGNANATGGNIELGGVNISTNGLNAAGNILAVANGGTANNGSIAIGNIGASSSAGPAGDVTLIGEGGINVGAIVNTGLTGGNVNLLVAQPTATGVVTIQNGNLLSGGYSAGVAGVGGVAVASIDAGNNVVITANQAAGMTIGNIQADNNISVTNNGSITINDDLLSDDGAISVLVNNTVGTAQVLTIDAGVNITAETQIDLVNTGLDRRLDFFNIGAGATIQTTAKVIGLGDVNLVMGNPASPPSNNNRLNRRFLVTETGGGTVNLFGNRRPRAVNPVNNLNAIGADVNITNSVGARNMFFGGGVTVTADPPVASGSPTYVNGRLVGGSERAAGNANAEAHNALEAMTAALNTSNLVSGNAFDQVQNNETLLSASTVIGTDALGNAGNGLTAGTVGTTGNTTSRTETLFGGVSQVSEGEDNSYMVSSSTGPVKEAEASICSDADLGTAGNAAHIAHNDRVVLKQGNVLFVPFRNTVVETPQGNVVIEAKSVALVSVSNDKLAVYDLEDSHKGAVSIEAHGQKITLAPGSHLTVASAKSGEFAQVNAIEAIPHRNVATKVIKNAKLHTSEFSVVSAMQSIKPLQAVMSSKHPQAKKVADRMMKTTAVLLTLGGNGEFQHFFKPALTAMK